MDTTDKKYIKRVILSDDIDNSSYLCGLPVVRYLAEHRAIEFTGDVTFFVGENGTDKSTLLEAIAVAYGFNAEGGSRNFAFSTNETHSDLYRYLTIAKNGYARDGYFLRAESFYNVASNIEALDEQPACAPPIIGSYGGVSLHRQSHGESFLALVHNRFGGNGLYILDEPEAALSPSRLFTLLSEIDALVKKDSQFIIATHSPVLMVYPGAQIYELTEDGIEAVDYKQTAHYQLTKRFLDNPERMLKALLED